MEEGIGGQVCVDVPMNDDEVEKDTMQWKPVADVELAGSWQSVVAKYFVWRLERYEH